MTPLLFRPFILNVSSENTNMLDPRQSTSRQISSNLSRVSTSSVNTNLDTRNHENVSIITGNKSSTSLMTGDKENFGTINNKVPKIILHRTHPPYFSMYRGSRLHHHRFKHNKGDNFKQQQYGSSMINSNLCDQHCDCCLKKVVKIT